MFSCIVLVSASSAYNTCGNCQVSKNHPRLTSPELDILENKILESHIYLFQAVVVSFSHHLTTLASIELQKISLEWNLCRHMPIEQVVRGCPHITSANFEGFQTPPPPLISNGQQLPYPPSPHRQHLADPPLPMYSRKKHFLV